MQKCILKSKALRLGTSRQNGALREPPQEGGRSAKPPLQDREARLRGCGPHGGGRRAWAGETPRRRPRPSPPRCHGLPAVSGAAPHRRLLRTDGPQRGHSDQAHQPLSRHGLGSTREMRKTRATGPVSSPRFITDTLRGADTGHAESLLSAPAFERLLWSRRQPMNPYGSGPCGRLAEPASALSSPAGAAHTVHLEPQSSRVLESGLH